MSLDQETEGLSVGDPEDDEHVLDGLEQLVADVRRRTVVPGTAETGAAAFGAFAPAGVAATEQSPIDTSAVMDVLHDAIERYAVADSVQGGEWVGPPLSDGEPPVHPVEEYRRDRRRVLAFVVILLFLLGGAAFATIGGGGDSKVKTNTTVPTGQSVTTVSLAVSTSVTAPIVETVPSTEATPQTAAVTTKPTPTTRKPAATTTTAPPDTTPADPCVDDPSLPECQPPTSSSSDTTTTTTTSTDPTIPSP